MYSTTSNNLHSMSLNSLEHNNDDVKISWDSRSNFQPLGVVDRGSETQPQVVENLNKLRVEYTDSHNVRYFVYCNRVHRHLIGIPVCICFPQKKTHQRAVEFAGITL